MFSLRLSFNEKGIMCKFKKCQFSQTPLNLFDGMDNIWSLHFRNHDLGVKVFGFPFCDKYLYTNLKINLDKVYLIGLALYSMEE